ncbi:MAG: ribosomal protein S18-alanine N-acetyltransferase [Candidatus Thorarchaeota archaeon]
MSYETRSIELSDVEEIVQIENACFSHPWDSSVFTFLAENNGYVQGFYRETRMLIVTIDEQIVAYVVWEVNHLDKKGHLQNLAVDKEHRRRGIARSLMNRVFSFLTEANASRCTLEVRESNVGAHALYKELGMTPVSRHRHYYGDEDAIIYCIDF